MSVPMIAGLYPYTRGGVTHPPRVTLAEIPASLDANPTYRDQLLVLAGDENSARQLTAFGLRVHRVFGDAPAEVRHDTAHKMKHWMCSGP